MNNWPKFKIRALAFSLGLIILIPGILRSQLNPANLSQLTEKDGLPGSQVRRLIVDKSGFLWLGTINGLARYDGYEFKRFFYDPNDSASIQGLSVWSLMEDRDGQIWVATGPANLNRYDPVMKRFRQFEFADLITHGLDIEVGIAAMEQDNQGRIYFGADTYYSDVINSALLYMDPGENALKVLKTPDSLPIKNILSLARDKYDNIWCLSMSGIFKIDKDRNLTKIHAMDAAILSQKDLPTDLKVDHQGKIWIVTSASRLFEFSSTSGEYKVWDENYGKTNVSINFYRSLTVDKNDNIWFSRNGGIEFLDRKTGETKTFGNGLQKEFANVTVLDFAFDSFGTLWMGTDASGLLKYEDKPQFRSYVFSKYDRNSIAEGWVNLLSEASDGKIWCTTSGTTAYSGISVLDTRNGEIKTFPFSKLSPFLNLVTAIWEHEPGEMYLGTLSGIYAFSEKTQQLRRVKLMDAPDSVSVTFHLLDSRDNEWFCSSKGLYVKRNGFAKCEWYDLSKVKGGDQGSNKISRVYESLKHGLWITTDNGLFLYDYASDSVRRVGYNQKESEIFVTQDINSLCEGQDGLVWVGTWMGGLSVYNPESRSIQTYTRNDGLPSMSIQSILPDEKNNCLWLSTFDGLSRFDLAKHQFINFSIGDGIQGQQFADVSFLKTSKGQFAFGGSNGFTIFSPDQVNISSIPPKVFLTDLRLFNQPVIPGRKSVLTRPIDQTKELTLPYNKNNITLEYLAIHYANPQKNKYKYQLEHYDNDWREVGNQREAFYPNLPPGEYVFRLKAANDKGLWNEDGVTLRIIINAPWWRTYWAYIAYVLVAAAIAYGLNRYFHGRVLKMEREKNRARELEQAREIQIAYHKLEETYETLKATQTQLIHSEKMASLGELTAGIAHEIQNPLNFVNNFSEINAELIDEVQYELKSGKTNGITDLLESIRENEQKIGYHGKRADSIVKGMLQHSRMSAGQMEMTDLNAIADEYIRLSYHGIRGKNKNFSAAFRTKFDDSIGRINIVRQDIGRVLLNLFNNAFYAVAEKQDQHIDGYQPAVEVETKKYPDKIEIRVSDNGIGIPQKNMDRIFQPFFTTKPAGQGTGLGLSLSFDTVRAHNGNIRVESTEGKGSTFIIELPLD
jgi:signal transduction histidine kinase/ligand-binding sensor domain-containing protein